MNKHVFIALYIYLYFAFDVSVEIILRAEAVEKAQAGDKCDFTGTLIVVPDVAQINMPGSRAETRGARGGKGRKCAKLSFGFNDDKCFLLQTVLSFSFFFIFNQIPKWF